ncbi:NAD(P)-dependent oxidoreductase [Variovorax sp. RA8]|uniref:NAD(P)-dependent oxidoreductase n=1 Tax=Variovorax sp. (strain JCM 16519 / RA8) TaxID=662548 RepID=UPI0013181BAD|nr:NAD(P)-dependent oxidoreductase [Variovorax sp. RA8]VTU28622.1 D-specific alpha-keto acid dehydrogenase [Variovorax sp. RA8]
MNSNPAILVMRDTVIGDALDELAARLQAEGALVRRGDDAVAARRPLEVCVNAAHLNACEVIVSTPRYSIGPDTLAAAPQLKSIVLPTIGIDSVDVDAVAARGITVANSATPENFEGLAEATVLLMLTLIRHPRSPRGVSRSLQGKTVGLLGFGRVGRSVAQRLQGWGAQLLAHAPSSQTATEGVRLVPFDTLLSESDMLSVHSTLNATSRHLIDRRAIERMKAGAWLINTARGGLVDEDALCDALESGHLGGAAIDVFEVEPLPEKSRLRAAPCVILTPHRVGHTVELYRSLADAAYANVAAAISKARAG